MRVDVLINEYNDKNLRSSFRVSLFSIKAELDSPLSYNLARYEFWSS